ncbi:MAG: sugar ABC transporter ATP-binding protein, partial [Pseudomonadota bacterium]
MSTSTYAPPALELRGLKKSFGNVRAVADGNLAVEAGSVVALLGANGAGKSTLVNMLGGVVRPDGGEIRRSGKVVSFAGPQDAARAGIAFVQQELTLFPTLTVAENVFADHYPTRWGCLDKAVMRARTRELLAGLGADLDPDQTLEGLSTGACQMVEIARAMRREPEVVIFDEPTSSLAAREKERFEAVVRLLAGRGVAVIYITHFIDEIFGVCDRAVVMREGETVADMRVEETDHAAIVEAMLGSVEASGRLAATEPDVGEPLLSVRNLALPGRVVNASFTLRRGEIVGLWGLLGSGRTELVRALLGLDGIPSGDIALDADGDGLTKASPQDVRAMAAFVTEDRKAEGLLLPFSVADNIAMPNLPALSGWGGRVRFSAARAMARSVIDALSIKVSGPTQRV